MEWRVREGVVEEQHLMWGVTDKVYNDADHQHLNHTYTLLHRIRLTLSLHAIVVHHYLVPVELLGAGKQVFTNDWVADDLEYHGNHVEQAELHILEDGEIFDVIAWEA